MEQVLAIGDNENDNEMLTQAGIGSRQWEMQSSYQACADLTARKEAELGRRDHPPDLFEENEKVKLSTYNQYGV